MGSYFNDKCNYGFTMSRNFEEVTKIHVLKIHFQSYAYTYFLNKKSTPINGPGRGGIMSNQGNIVLLSLCCRSSYVRMIRHLVKELLAERGNLMAEFRVWILKVKPMSDICDDFRCWFVSKYCLKHQVMICFHL